MTDRSTVEAMLSSVATSIDWPEPSDQLSARVVARLESQARPAPRSRRLAVAFVAIVIVGGVLVIPSARQVVADLLGAAGVRIGLTSAPAPPTGARLDLGRATSLSDVRGEVDFTVRVPGGDQPGPPDGVFVSDNGQVAMLWEGTALLPAAVGIDVAILLTQGQGGAGRDVAEKAVGPGTQIRSITVEGNPALWIEGVPHTLTMLDADGTPVEETTRLAANVLLWEFEGVNHRLETTGDLQGALDLVAGLQPLR